MFSVWNKWELSIARHKRQKFQVNLQVYELMANFWSEILNLYFDKWSLHKSGVDTPRDTHNDPAMFMTS